MDGKALAALVKAGVPTFSMSSIHKGEEHSWEKRHDGDLGRHDKFHQMGREKIQLIHTFVHLGYDLVLTDVDTVWLRDPLPFFWRYPEADILCSAVSPPHPFMQHEPTPSAHESTPSLHLPYAA
jgi:hypothetical protein